MSRLNFMWTQASAVRVMNTDFPLSENRYAVAGHALELIGYVPPCAHERVRKDKAARRGIMSVSPPGWLRIAPESVSSDWRATGRDRYRAMRRVACMIPAIGRM